MDPAVRRTISELNPLLIESWCLKCGLFIAASNDLKKLAAAEGSHPCLTASSKLGQAEADFQKTASTDGLKLNPAPEKQGLEAIKRQTRKDREEREAS